MADVTSRFACPDCYGPVPAPRRGQDGRCTGCRGRLTKKTHKPKKKTEEEYPD